MKGKIRISQCMIVKNEEKNIQRALSWAKDIVFEQIVVDTGSTDRTVEIAEAMGAKVYHFQWIDDFAAAKNYAIDQASGEWIAFLDADEYMNQEDTRKLVRLLGQISTPKKGEKFPLFIRCAWVQLDDNGKPFSVDPQDRIFRNRKDLRYQGKIHEQIQLPPGRQFTFIQAENLLSIFHTGYGKSAYEETGKLQRNMELLERELKQDPENYMAWSYLGDVQKGSGDREGAAVSYRKALEGKQSGKLVRQRYLDARTGLMGVLAETAEETKSGEEILRWAEDYGYPNTDNPDPWFFLGLWHYNRREMEEAREQFLICLKKLETYRSYDKVVAEGSLRQIYVWLAQACLQLNRPQEAVRYCVLALRMERYQDKVLTSVLQLLKQEAGESNQAEGTWSFLQGLYDFQSPKDLLFLLKCAKLAGFHALENRVLQTMPEELKREFQKPSGEEAGRADRPAQSESRRADTGILNGVCSKEQQEDLIRELEENGLEHMQSSVSAMAQADPDFAFHMADLDWKTGDSLAERRTQYEMLLWALRLLAPLRAADERELCQKLYERFVFLAEALLPQIYHPALLGDEEAWAVLPATDRFGLWMRRAKEARATEDRLEYIRRLRSGLEQAPGMKEMVEFLIEEMDRAEKSELEVAQVTPELRQLAEQVKAILSQYAPDDPVVRQLKASPAYQKVAALLEAAEDPTSL